MDKFKPGDRIRNVILDAIGEHAFQNSCQSWGSENENFEKKKFETGRGRG